MRGPHRPLQTNLKYPSTAEHQLRDRLTPAPPIKDIDLWEINEAFASQFGYTVESLGIDYDKVNVNGGAIAIGHPLAVSGTRMTITLLKELRRRGGKLGVVSMCIGGGMGAAAVFRAE